MESFWIQEFTVSKAKACVPISSVCNVKCVFCSNQNNPFEMPKPEFRDINDIKKNFQAVELEEAIKLCENLPGRIKEGESLLHPKLWEILDITRKRFPEKYIVFATNGSMLTEEFVFNLATYKPIAIDTLSINSCNPENWIKLMRGNLKQAQVAINSAKLLCEYNIPFRGSLVAMPEITGYDDIYQTILYASKYNCLSFIIWLPGYTKYTPENIKRQMKIDEDKIKSLISQARKDTGMEIELIPRILAGKDNERIKQIFKKYSNGTNLFMSSEAAFSNINTNVKQYSGNSNENYVVAVPNKTYGGNIQVAGLLMVDDFVEAAKLFISKNPTVKLTRAFIPHEPFDTLGRDLMFNHLNKIEDVLGCPVYQA